jgi:hypothetical protein
MGLITTVSKIRIVVSRADTTCRLTRTEQYRSASLGW